MFNATPGTALRRAPGGGGSGPHFVNAAFGATPEPSPYVGGGGGGGRGSSSRGGAAGIAGVGPGAAVAASGCGSGGGGSVCVSADAWLAMPPTLPLATRLPASRPAQQQQQQQVSAWKAGSSNKLGEAGEGGHERLHAGR